ncbi:hypothetical protein TKK_0003547 [Trichogramma kaykai]
MVATSVKWAQDAHINWELNERISLSSAGSETVSPSGTNGRASSINNKRQQQQQRRQVQQSLQQRQQQQQQQLQQPQGTPVQRRWNIAKDRLDRTNDALAKRLSVIQELNNKILANYDKMQEGGRRKARWIPKDPSIDAAEPNYNDNDELRDSPAARNEPAKKVSGSFVAEKRRILGEKMNFQRRAGGEWILPSENKANEKRDDSGPVETDKKCNHKCTLLRNQRVASSATTAKSSPIGPVTTTMQPSASSSPISWIKDESLSTSSSSATSSIAPQESNVLRELNEAIDRFEEREEEELEEDEDDTKLGHHDSSWDSGVGCDVSLKPAKGTGWLRIHVGQESSLVYLTLETSASDVCRDMLLSENLALFVQYGGDAGRRLSSQERPLELQEQLLEALGYKEPTRRARLGLDAELRHLIRFHVGPAAPVNELHGYSRCGYALVLKGLVFPQWKKRALAVVGSRIFLYPACTESNPEWMDLTGVCSGPSRLGKYVLRVTGQPARLTTQVKSSGDEGIKEDDTCNQEQQQQQKGGKEARHLYLGFHHPWDRELWKVWIKQAIRSPGSSDYLDRLDMSDTGMSRLPEAVRTYASGLPNNNNNNNNNNNDDDDENDNRNNNTNNNVALREFFLGNNQLTTSNANLELLHSFPELQELHLENNRLDLVPSELLKLESLVYLDLSDNRIQYLPREIHRLVNLQELIADRNVIRELPAELGRLGQLRVLSLAGNLIESLPDFLLEMRALTLTDVLAGSRESSATAAANVAAAANKSNSDEKSNLNSSKANNNNNNNNSLYKVNLRNNQLKGNIILGNYGNLTHLDLSENSIEKLDLSALQELRSVRCARNVLTELTLCGRSLVSLIAGNNKLKKLTIVPVPTNLEHLDVSYNELDSLPEWTPDLPVLRALFASHNLLTALPDRLLSQQASSRLEVLHLPHNRLQALPPPRRQLGLVHLTLQDNALTALPANFFHNTLKMKVLNLSNNRLSELPTGYTEPSTTTRIGRHQEACVDRSRSCLEKLYLTGNRLSNTALDTLAKFQALRVLHLAYNSIDALPESCIGSWHELEELVLSGNKLQYLPDNVANLAHLRVLRVHSNRLLSCPAFNKTSSLKVLDLAHNHLDRLNLDDLLSAQLQFLDISCNSRLRVDPRQFQHYNSTRRPLSLVDVSGQSKSGSPGAGPMSDGNGPLTAGGVSSVASSSTTPVRGQHAREVVHLPWRLGFSETAGTRERLLVSQVRMPGFCNAEGLFGLFDGGSSSQEAPTSLQEMIPRLLLQERTVKETRHEYLRYTLLAAQREIRTGGARNESALHANQQMRMLYGVDAALVHLRRLEHDPEANDVNGARSVKYVLTAATCGEAKAVLCRASGPLQLAKSHAAQYVPPGVAGRAAAAAGAPEQKTRCGNLLPIAMPEPTSQEVIIEPDDEFVIIGNRRLWEVLSIQEAVREARAEANPVLAAKRLQDLAQAYGAEDNLSVLVVRLSASRNNPQQQQQQQPPQQPLHNHRQDEAQQQINRLLMHEYNKAQQSKDVAAASGACTCPCCMPRLAANEASAACCCHAAAAAAAAAVAAVGTTSPGHNDSVTSSVNGFYLNGVLRNLMSNRSSVKSSRSSQRLAKDNQLREERSSPSGQSDQASEIGLFEPRSRRRASGSSRLASACKLRQQQQQQQQVIIERDSPPSDEQLRCWEYMLEQNTQLLFDKELDTLTSVPKASSISSTTNSATLLRRGQSRSTPQLGASSSVPFLSRRFGSARSFETTSGAASTTTTATIHQPVPILRSAFGGSGRRVLNGGPNAAYFGSLQRLMPYNLEYDFAVIQERGNALDSLEQDASRMQQYWGVATTEL